MSASFPVEAKFHTFKPTVVPQPPPIEEPELDEFRERGRDGLVGAGGRIRAGGGDRGRSAADHLAADGCGSGIFFNALAAAQAMPSDEELDEMVREMIRPLLKAWLDDNLPVLVERLVRAEIERVARGGR